MSTYVFNVCLETKYNCFEVRIMFVATLDPLKVGKTVAFFRNQKGLSQEVVSGLADIGRTI